MRIFHQGKLQPVWTSWESPPPRFWWDPNMLWPGRVLHLSQRKKEIGHKQFAKYCHFVHPHVPISKSLVPLAALQAHSLSQLIAIPLNNRTVECGGHISKHMGPVQPNTSPKHPKELLHFPVHGRQKRHKNMTHKAVTCLKQGKWFSRYSSSTNLLYSQCLCMLSCYSSS